MLSLSRREPLNGDCSLASVCHFGSDVRAEESCLFKGSITQKMQTHFIPPNTPGSIFVYFQGERMKNAHFSVFDGTLTHCHAVDGTNHGGPYLLDRLDVIQTPCEHNSWVPPLSVVILVPCDCFPTCMHSAKPDESSWDSPWGPGRPGWHIQCSEMSMPFDIHGGGKGLIFPDDETEIGQSCAACSVNNARYWMHTDFSLNKSTEPGKSIGNIITIREALRLYHPLALRFLLMDKHYRMCWFNYSSSSKNLENASDQVFNIYQALYDCEMTLSPFREKSFKDEITPYTQNCIHRLRECFRSSMAWDLKAYCVLNEVRKAVKTINMILYSLKKNQQQPSLIQSLIALEKEVKDVLSVLGLMSSSTYSEVLKQLKDKTMKRTGLTEYPLLQLIEQRTSARNKMDKRIQLNLKAARACIIRQEKDREIFLEKENTETM